MAKIPKSISIDNEFLDWIKSNHSTWYYKFSENIVNLIKDELETSKDNAISFRKRQVAKNLKQALDMIERGKILKASSLNELEFLEVKEKQTITKLHNKNKEAKK